MNDLLITDCVVEGTAQLDIRIQNGVIIAIGHGLTSGSADTLTAQGNTVIPGLHDHHIHLHALAARRSSVECGPPQVHSASELAAAIDNSKGVDGWVRGVGYFESVAGDLDRDSLDQLHDSRPVRIQHRSGALWILNSEAVSAARLQEGDHRGVERDWTGRPTGRVWRADTWLRNRIPVNAPPSLKAIGDELVALGITSVTDATPDLDQAGIDSIASAISTGDLPQRVHLLGAPLGVGDISQRLTVGPYKIVLADSDLPDLDQLALTILRSHNMNRPIAAHCVSREALLILLSVLNDVGSIPGDRIEHGALIPAESIDDIYRLGLTVVTQPGFIADRGDDYLRHVDQVDIVDLYRCRSLLEAEVPFALSSDAPYGPLDPWAVMSAAVNRTTSSGVSLGEVETISHSVALERYLGASNAPGGQPRRIEVGSSGDLLVLSGQSDPQVLVTIIDGVPFAGG